jgi:predicted  nucleic acid-binding Zn-ribbon protein
MSDPFRDETTALEARADQLRGEIDELRAQLEAFEGENRNVVVAAQFAQLRADIATSKAERSRLLAELGEGG